MGDMCVVNGVVGVCIEIVWLAAVGCVVDLGSAGLPFVLNLFLLMSRSCLSCCMRRYCGVVGVGITKDADVISRRNFGQQLLQ